MRQDEILQAALSLTETERANIADRLLLSLETTTQREIDALWAQEAEARIEAYEAGEIDAVPGDEVFAEVRARRNG